MPNSKMTTKAVILAAGSGRRLGGASNGLPKCLLEFTGASLLQRHLDLLAECGINRTVIGVGYRSELIGELVATPTNSDRNIDLVNADCRKGSISTLWNLRRHLYDADSVLLMDADVLYDYRMLDRLLESQHADCFLLDRNLEPGEEPVKICIRDGSMAEFRKRVKTDFDFCGESVGFFRLSRKTVVDVLAATQRYIEAGRVNEEHEEPLRDVLLADPKRFGYEDITGLPWTEIDFQEVSNAHARTFCRT